ncbi:MAG: hypothetical protein D6806_13560 [Deltaproteobacteria bacterium]|nr:MAG: hypothetical protein D6806_13560 [Deltaproteobacteria bacterium]
MTELLAPLLSAWDPPPVSEGALDPLGLYPIADRLGILLAPGVRERQSEARYLVPICVGCVIGEELGIDEVAADGMTQPWLVYEWYIVEALVRSRGRTKPLMGLPGREKVTTAIQHGEPVCARTYLKTPAIFGFHGVYRTLAETLELIDSEGRLLEAGLELVQHWEAEAGLKGFVTGLGPGRELRKMLVEAVRAGMDAARTARSPGWRGWALLARYLDPEHLGDQTQSGIWEILCNGGEVGWRRLLLEQLVTREGQRRWEEHSERTFHTWLYRKSPQGLRMLLDAIFSYERFSRLLLDAFEEVLFEAGRQSTKMHPRQLARFELLQRSIRKTAEAYHQVQQDLVALEANDLLAEFTDRFQEFGRELKGEDWIELLLQHHWRIQAHKPPAGKAPWLDRFDDGSFMTRPLYRREEAPEGGDEYVHQYRTNPLDAFCRTLHRVPT